MNKMKRLKDCVQTMEDNKTYILTGYIDCNDYIRIPILSNTEGKNIKEAYRFLNGKFWTKGNFELYYEDDFSYTFTSEDLENLICLSEDELDIKNVVQTLDKLNLLLTTVDIVEQINYSFE